MPTASCNRCGQPVEWSDHTDTDPGGWSHVDAALDKAHTPVVVGG